MDVIEALARDSATRDWPGLGLAVQAYSKRALDVIDWVAETALAERQAHDRAPGQGRLLGQRIKRSQERGLEGYPVYTRKVTTDVSYLACAGRLFNHADMILPAVRHSQRAQHRIDFGTGAGRPNYEFQRLHGMGRLLYAEAARQVPNFPQVRVYAPVGEHKDLLAYLVRRLLENGANTSFVNRFMDEQVPVADIVRDPISELERLEAFPIRGCRIPSRCMRTGAIPAGWISAIRWNWRPCATGSRAGALLGAYGRARSSMACCRRAARMRSPIRPTAAISWAVRAMRRRPRSSRRSTRLRRAQPAWNA